MTTPGIRDASEAVPVPMTEAAMALQLRRAGHRVIQHRGRWWLRSARTYCQPVHSLARLSAHEASAPHPICWAYRAALAEADEDRANGSFPAHLLADVQAYDASALSSNRRYHLRRSQRLVQFVQVVSPEIMGAQGYEVFVSAQQRTKNPYRTLGSREAYLAEVAGWFGSDSKILLAGLIDGRMGGYIAGHVVDRTAYVDIVDVATESLQTHISTGLHHEFIQACRRAPQIREIMHSPHEPEDPALGVFKAGIGFPVVHVPSRVRLVPPLGQLIRRRHPFKYYRLTGKVDPRLLAAAPRSEAADGP